MFARQVDPFQAYNSALSAAEKRHKDLLAQEDFQHEKELNQRLGQQQQPPHIDSSSRRKRSFVFEPEFLSALDSAVSDNNTNKRPCKKARCSVSFTRPESSHPIKLSTLPKKASSSTTTTNGASIVDLSSGEELVALHVGDSDHKRRRESIAGALEEEESLREVFDVQEDGSLRATMEHAPIQPSPTKRVKIHKAKPSSHLHVLAPIEEVKGRKPSPTSNRLFSHIRNKNKYRSQQTNTTISNTVASSSSADLDAWMSEDDEDDLPRRLPIPRPELQALVRYQGPKSMSLAEGVDAFIRDRLSDESLSLQDALGHELVLYRGDRGDITSSPRDSLAGSSLYPTEIFSSTSTTVIEELDDDEDDDGSQSIINDLQDKIMDMDLD